MLRELDAAPRLGRLFVKAAVPSRRSADSLPGHGYARAGVRADAARVAEYARVCGFGVSGTLPVTYPHILAFPMQTKLMTDPEFPFPLIGTVHIGNRIRSLRPIGLTEPLVLRVSAENLRPHDRGSQFDIVTEALADGEPVWHEVSTYLRRTKSGGGGSGERESAPPEHPAAVWRVPADTGRRYARVSGDRNPIHLHALTARPFGFPAAIAHGMWSLARCLAFFAGRLPDAYAVDARFKLPIRLPAKVALTANDSRFELADAKSGRPHLSGRIDQADVSG